MNKLIDAIQRDCLQKMGNTVDDFCCANTVTYVLLNIKMNGNRIHILFPGKIEIVYV